MEELPGDTEMNEFGNHEFPNDEDSQIIETYFGGNDWVVSINNLQDNASYVDSDNRIIADEDSVKRSREHENVKDFFTKILGLEPQCIDPEFIDYLLDKNILSIERKPGYVADYRGKYFQGVFETVDRSFGGMDTKLIRGGIRERYDEWKEIINRRVRKRAGVVVGIGLSIAAVVTGLAVGLTRGGSDIIHAGKKRRKWEKLNPSKVTIPWSDIEEDGGSALVFTGENLTVILAVSAVYLTVRR